MKKDLFVKLYECDGCEFYKQLDIDGVKIENIHYCQVANMLVNRNIKLKELNICPYHLIATLRKTL